MHLDHLKLVNCYKYTLGIVTCKEQLSLVPLTHRFEMQVFLSQCPDLDRVWWDLFLLLTSPTFDKHDAYKPVLQSVSSVS